MCSRVEMPFLPFRRAGQKKSRTGLSKGRPPPAGARGATASRTPSLRKPAQHERMVEGLRKAGIPEGDKKPN
jgi:hypothetical protein